MILQKHCYLNLDYWKNCKTHTNIKVNVKKGKSVTKKDKSVTKKSEYDLEYINWEN